MRNIKSGFNFSIFSTHARPHMMKPGKCLEIQEGGNDSDAEKCEHRGT